jgi:hypothetical protein
MTRDEARAKCIEAMVEGGNKLRRGHGPSWETMAAAFDALHGIARVDPVEATEKMITAARAARQAHKDMSMPELLDDTLWRAMSAAGDLTNGPETKL